MFVISHACPKFNATFGQNKPNDMGHYAKNHSV